MWKSCEQQSYSAIAPSVFSITFDFLLKIETSVREVAVRLKVETEPSLDSGALHRCDEWSGVNFLSTKEKRIFYTENAAHKQLNIAPMGSNLK